MSDHWKRIFFPVLLISVGAGCATAPKDPDGKYEYNGTEIDANRAILQGYSPVVATVAAAQGVFSTTNDRPTAGMKQRIKGKCLVRAQGDASADMACAGVTLVLTEVNGPIAAQTGTSTTGEFNFMAETQKQYVISPTSRSYIMDDDSQGPFDAGTKIVIHLRLK